MPFPDGSSLQFPETPIPTWAFSIDPRDLAIVGFGRDRSAQAYLQVLLTQITVYNDGVSILAPVYVDGDGSCLVHAISRALCGNVSPRDVFNCSCNRLSAENHLTFNFRKSTGTHCDPHSSITC